MALYPREGAWHWLGMTCLWRSWWGAEEGDPLPTSSLLGCRLLREGPGLGCAWPCSWTLQCLPCAQRVAI